MTSTDTSLPLDASDTNVNVPVDEIDRDIATTMADPVVKDEPRAEQDSIAPSGLIARDDIIDAKVEAPIVATTSTTKSISESNNKIIKELDDETAKTFPQILMEVLTNDEDSDTISWLPHGRSFIIYKKKKFASQVLVKYFKATKFTSFTRKLNRWGFTRVTRGPEMGSYFHKMFLRDNPELCLRMSSLTSSKYNHTHHDPTNPIHSNSPHINGHLIMSPMGVPGFVPGGFPMVQFPFFGMPAMPPGAAPTFMQTKMPAVPATPAELSQQNHYINQQLQHLQWQQFQLQQFQQQQIQASQHAASSVPAASNANSNSGAQHQQPPPGMPPPQIGVPYSPQQLQKQTFSGVPENGVPGTPGTVTNQAEENQHSVTTTPHTGQQQQHIPPLMNLSTNGGPHPLQPHQNYQQQHSRPGGSQQPQNHQPYGHHSQYPYGQQQQQHPGHSPNRHQGGHLQSNPYQYPQQQPYHNTHQQHIHQHTQQQQYHHQQQQHYNPPVDPDQITDPTQQQSSEIEELPSPSTEQSPETDAADEIVEQLEQNGQNNDSIVAGATEIVDKGDLEE